MKEEDASSLILVLRIAAWAIVASTVIGLLWGCFYTVDAGERAVVLRNGQISSIEGDGLHFKAPFIDSVKTVNIRTQKTESPADAGTRDLQHVETKVAVNFHYNAGGLANMYRTIGIDDVDDRVVNPRIMEVVKAVVARFSAEDLLKRRDDVRQEIVSGLRSKLSQYNLTLEDVQITNFKFSAVFNAAIEGKQTAEQQALKATNDLTRIKVEAQQKIAMAQAEAETIRIQAEAIRAQGGAEYVQLKAIEKWDGKLPQVAGSNTPFINLK